MTHILVATDAWHPQVNGVVRTLASCIRDSSAKFALVVAKDTEHQAPMVDLLKDKNLGKILVSFHESHRPTGIICHGPIVLLSTLPDPDAFIASMIAGDGKASSLTQGWPYGGYRVTIFSTGEEQALETRLVDHLGPVQECWQRKNQRDISYR